MVEFIEERIIGNPLHGSSFNERYAVEATKTANDKVDKKLLHPFPIRRFDLSYFRDDIDLWEDLMSLYHRLYGTFAGFRFFHPFEYSTNGRDGTATAFDHTLVQLTTTTYQLSKEYGLGETPLGSLGRPRRHIFKPIGGTVKISIANVEQFSGWTVDLTTGIVTFPTPPSGTVRGGCHFDFPVSFVEDLSVTHTDYNINNTDQVVIEELVCLND